MRALFPQGLHPFGGGRRLRFRLRLLQVRRMPGQEAGGHPDRPGSTQAFRLTCRQGLPSPLGRPDPGPAVPAGGPLGAGCPRWFAPTQTVSGAMRRPKSTSRRNTAARFAVEGLIGGETLPWVFHGIEVHPSWVGANHQGTDGAQGAAGRHGRGGTRTPQWAYLSGSSARASTCCARKRCSSSGPRIPRRCSIRARPNTRARVP